MCMVILKLCFKRHKQNACCKPIISILAQIVLVLARFEVFG